MSKPSTDVSIHQQAADELAHRALPKADRGARPAHISPDVWKLGGADLRAMAGALAAGITTHVEARRAEREAAKAAKPAQVAPKAPAGPASKPAEVRTYGSANTRPVVTQAQACKLAADLLRASGYPVPRALTTLAKGRNLAPRTK